MILNLASDCVSVCVSVRKWAGCLGSRPGLRDGREGDLVLDYARRRVTLSGSPSPLTANAGRTLTYERLLQRVWGPENNGEVDAARREGAARKGDELGYSLAWMTTRPPSTTSMFRLWLSSMRILTRRPPRYWLPVTFPSTREWDIRAASRLRRVAPRLPHVEGRTQNNGRRDGAEGEARGHRDALAFLSLATPYCSGRGPR